ncbi:MAG: bifunctional adenosylcobinamide kinase/adenosylcobinamide-phosphate guanylyltransferase [Ilumatobacteraceae bacterium]
MSTTSGLLLLLGGARSGKSALAVELGRRHDGPVTFVATLDPFDDELTARVGRHRAERPDWPTIEERLDLAAALRRADGLVIVDCLTLWINNLLQRGDTDDEIEALAVGTASMAAERSEPTIVVSNEVGLSVHPETPLGRRYRDVLGRVNQRWAARAQRSLLLVAGRAVRLDDPADVLRP